jgi:hypothetical protein
VFASVISWPPTPTAQQSSLKCMIMPCHNYGVIVRGESLGEFFERIAKSPNSKWKRSTYNTKAKAKKTKGKAK